MTRDLPRKRELRPKGHFEIEQLFQFAMMAGLALVFCIAVIDGVLVDATRPMSDFVEYWAAGRLIAIGNNPYDPQGLTALQQNAGYGHNTPMMMLSPPWALPLQMPFGLLAYPVSRVAWGVLHAVLLLLSVAGFWRLVGGTEKATWISAVVALSFIPGIFALLAGQISILLLVGAWGYIEAIRRKRWWIAGVCASLFAVKPQLTYLFWLALIYWTMRTRQWRVIGGVAATLTALTLVATIWNPQVLPQYLASLSQPSYYWITPTIGAVLRLVFGWEHYWLQFVAPAVGALTFSIWWRRHGRALEWAASMPILLLISVITSAFGWIFDQVILLPLVLLLTSVSGPSRSSTRLWLIFYVVVNILAVVTHVAPSLDVSWVTAHGSDITGDGWGVVSSIWQRSRAWGVVVAPMIAVWYWAAMQVKRGQI